MSLISHKELTRRIHYNPETGIFTWRITRPNGVKVGDRINNRDELGYLKLNFNGRLYVASRVAIFYMTVRWPPNDVDHHDGDPTNDRYRNLRPATESQNMGNRRKSKNNRSGYKGVFWRSERGVWNARIGVTKNGRHLKIYLGQSSSPEEAARLYDRAAKEYWGDFAKLNFPEAA